MTQKEVENSEEEKKCKFCREIILEDAVVCRYCGREKLRDNEIIQLENSNFFWSLFPYAIFASVTLFFVNIRIGLMSFFVIFGFIAIRNRYRKKQSLQDIAYLQRLNKGYKLDSIIATFILFLGLLMLITNPQKKDVYEHIRAEYSISKNVKIEITEVKDYFIFSTYSVDVDIDLLSKERHYYIGILNRIFELDSNLRILNSNEHSEMKGRNR